MSLNDLKMTFKLRFIHKKFVLRNLLVFVLKSQFARIRKLLKYAVIIKNINNDIYGLISNIRSLM